MKKLYSARTNADAHVVAGVLKNHGIDAEVHDQHASSLGVPVMGIDMYPSIWVRDEDYQKAKEIVDTIERAPRLVD